MLRSARDCYYARACLWEDLPNDRARQESVFHKKRGIDRVLLHNIRIGVIHA